MDLILTIRAGPHLLKSRIKPKQNSIKVLCCYYNIQIQDFLYFFCSPYFLALKVELDPVEESESSSDLKSQVFGKRVSWGSATLEWGPMADRGFRLGRLGGTSNGRVKTSNDKIKILRSYRLMAKEFLQSRCTRITSASYRAHLLKPELSKINTLQVHTTYLQILL